MTWTLKNTAIGSDGWIRDMNGNLLLWIPSDMQHGVMRDMSIMTLPPNAPNHSVVLDGVNLQLGRNWANGYGTV